MEQAFGFTPSPAPMRRVRTIQFGIMPPEEIVSQPTASSALHTVTQVLLAETAICLRN